MKKINIFLILLIIGISAKSQKSVIDCSKYPKLIIFTQQQDQANMMKQLGIKKLRPGPSGDANAPNAANYNEKAANPCPLLPNVLVTKQGKTVTNTDSWWNERRPEIVEDLEKEVYGRLPNKIPKVIWTVKITDREFIGRTPAIVKKIM